MNTRLIKGSWGFKRYTAAGLFLSACFYGAAVQAMEIEPAENGGMLKIQLSQEEAKEKYHKIKKAIELTEEKGEAIRALHENEYYLWNMGKEGAFDEKMGITTVDGHTVCRPKLENKSPSFESITYENCPKCIEMKNETYEKFNEGKVVKEKYHQLKEELNLIKGKKESMGLIHEEAYKLWEDRKGVNIWRDERTDILNANFHALSKKNEKLSHENCPNCIKMLNEEYGVIIKNSPSHLFVYEKANEGNVVDFHLAIQKKYKQIQELEELSKTGDLIIEQSPPSLPANKKNNEEKVAAEEKEEAYRLAIDKQYKQIQALEEKEEAYRLAINKQYKQIQALEEKEEAYRLAFDKQYKQIQALEENLLNRLNVSPQDLENENKVLENKNKDLELKYDFVMSVNSKLYEQIKALEEENRDLKKEVEKPEERREESFEEEFNIEPLAHKELLK